MSKYNRISVWADSDSEKDIRSREAIIQSFHNAKNFFEPEMKYIESNANDKPKETQLMQNAIKDEFNNDFPSSKDGEFLQKKKEREKESEANEIDGEIGPQPIKIEYDKKEERKLYQGMNINLTEAQLYAQYIQKGKRIPRRGEVGITSNEIEYFESIGYVMSGTRHKKMNAARQRIEGKVYSAEDKRALSIFNLEENLRKEKNIINGFMHMLKNKTMEKSNIKEDNI